MKAQETKRYRDQVELAMRSYNLHYDNLLFQSATHDKTSKYANALIDEALALCGHPYYGISHRNWGYYASAFLEHFV